MQLSDKFADKSSVICIVGLGYVGLPTAVSFAEKGFRVIGTDKKQDVVELIDRSGCHLKEHDLDERVKKLFGLKHSSVTSFNSCGAS